MKKLNNPGKLLVITGVSGVGQDSVMNCFLDSSHAKKFKFQKVVTCTDRSPRPGEVDGKDYHFVSFERLQEMDCSGELVESITPFGSCNKATSKNEIKKLLNGESLVWRIDLSRATEVASGDFFKRIFPEHSHVLQKHTTVIFVTAPKHVIEDRRKNRDGERYNQKEYEARDNQVASYVEILKQLAISIENLEGKLDDAVNRVIEHITKIND